MSRTTMANRTAAQIRQEFIDYFARKQGHTFVHSSPVIPHQDPTLLFTNAGMNQFKDVFLGQGTRPYRRAVNTQKCIRAGGKHNDLEDVGKDGYHHTFFEMLGNWSFGDYFKEEAIAWAWELLTEVWGVERDRLYVSVFAGDQNDGLEPDLEAESIWARHIAGDRVSRWGRKDNFWEMGDTGPCGPCSEIHYDNRPDDERARVPGHELVNGDHPDVVEIWNLVFIQFNRSEGGRLGKLPASHVDTGMGFERLVRVLQGKQSNYDTDIWMPLIEAIQQHTQAHDYGGKTEDPLDIAYRVIADHIRCLTVAITDGGRPSNEKAGYVLRRILRRAVRHAHQTLGVDGPLLYRLVPAVVQSLGPAFPEIEKNPDHVAEIIRDEEESFLRTLDRGLALFANAAEGAGAGQVISSEDAFRLHDTYGFPIDLTRVMAEERGLSVDEPGYERRMEAARERSRQAGGGEEQITLPPDAIARLKHLGVDPTADIDKYHGRPLSTQVEAIWNGTDFDEVIHTGTTAAVIVKRTNHYAEAGGQVGDSGQLSADVFDFGTVPGRGFSGRDPSGDCRFAIHDTRLAGGYVMHIGAVVEGKLRVGDKVTMYVDRDRRTPTRANHTATHLMNHALREVVGEDEQQKGSLVAADRLRFDFSCTHALNNDQIESVESMVNRAIADGLAVHADVVPLATALSINGIRAVFGEQYPDPVRVVSIGATVSEIVADPANPRWRGLSTELCGGTHLADSSEALGFVIVHEQALAAGVRRITALTGAAALAATAAGQDLLARVDAAGRLEGEPLLEEFDELSRLVNAMSIPAVTKHEVTARLDALRDRVKARRKARAGAREQVVTRAREIAVAGDNHVIVETIEGADREGLMTAMDVIRAKCPDSAAMLFGPDPDNGKVTIVAAVPEALIGRGLKAGDWVRQAATVCGGGGGGRPDMAQAGGKDPGKVPQAMVQARAYAEQALS